VTFAAADWRGALGAAVLSVVLAGAVCAAQEDAPAAPVLPAEIAGLPPSEQCTWLIRSIRLPEPPFEDPAPLLAGAARTVAGDLLGVLHARRVPAFRDEASQIMSVYQQTLVHDALRLLGREVVLPELTGFRAEHQDLEALSTTIEVWGLLGGVKELDEALWLAETAIDEETGELPKRVEKTLVPAVADILGRVPEAFFATRSSWHGWPTPILEAVLFALGEARDPRALEMLGDVMAFDRDMRELCLSQVRLVGRSAFADVNQRVVDIASSYLDVEQPSLCRTASLALGELQADEAIPELIQLLDHDEHGLSENAHWALRKITGMRFHNDPGMWTVWYREEMRWFQESARDVYAKLGSRVRHEAMAAIREVSRHTLNRHELARELARVLYHPYTDCRVKACEGLVRLGSTDVLPDLVYALGDREERVAAAAHAALVALTGGDRGPDPRDWEGLL
jgi:hypothetical protein